MRETEASLLKEGQVLRGPYRQGVSFYITVVIIGIIIVVISLLDPGLSQSVRRRAKSWKAGFDSRQGQEIFRYFTGSRPTLGPI
jgi:hypothetical protein